MIKPDSSVITDTFLIGDKIQVNVNIEIKNNILSTSIEFENISQKEVALWDFIFEIGNYYYFIDAFGKKGEYKVKIRIEYNYEITQESILILHPKEKKKYQETLEYTQINSGGYKISNKEVDILFQNTENISIVFIYNLPEELQRQIKMLIDPSVDQMVNFKRQYILN